MDRPDLADGDGGGSLSASPPQAGAAQAHPEHETWDPCSRDDCNAAAIAPWGRCLAHLSDEELGLMLAQAGGPSILDARGVSVPSRLVPAIRRKLPGGPQHPRFPPVRFDGARFAGPADFDSSTFTGMASFAGTIFQEDARFEHAVFAAGADFSRAAFGAEAHFSPSRFDEQASFRKAVFRQRVELAGAAFRRGLVLADASVEAAQQLGPLLVVGQLDLEGALFGAPLRLQVSAEAVRCVGTSFRAGVKLRPRWAELVIEESDFAATSFLAGAEPFDGLDEKELMAALGKERAAAGPVPRLLSLRWTDVANLALAQIDLRSCRLLSAYDLSGMRIGPGIRFPASPAEWSWRGSLKGWTRRRTVVEEHLWRRTSRRQKGWYPATSRAWEKLGGRDRLRPKEIEAIYRDLRKGREDNKDEGGATDFFFGEMEMRRLGSEKASERFFLWVFWLVAGYGARASRALICLLLIFLGFVAATAAWGFSSSSPHALSEVVLAGARISLGLPEDLPGTKLTLAGSVFETAFHVLGPGFLGLVLFSSVRRWIRR